eukprot:GHVS01083734.1.p3 GENE.GHVS01083734.1~~GHVS01083734.1.p3  ORF type:complete len:149 (-),score=24.67 GHVS01083734.1:15-461(-)
MSAIIVVLVFRSLCCGDMCVFTRLLCTHNRHTTTTTSPLRTSSSSSGGVLMCLSSLCAYHTSPYTYVRILVMCMYIANAHTMHVMSMYVYGVFIFALCVVYVHDMNKNTHTVETKRNGRHLRTCFCLWSRNTEKQKQLTQEQTMKQTM